MAFTEISPPQSPAKAERTAATTPEGNASASRTPPSAIKLANRLGLAYVTNDALTLRRQRKGKGFSYLTAQGDPIRDPRTVRRLKSLAVPPAYEEVRYAEDPQAHLQAIGRDAAGRLQYRYHPEWQKVREMRKASRLARFAEALPRIRRSIGQHLAGKGPTREFALACVIEMVAHSAIRPGSESYARMRGTRGAATLLKSNVVVAGDTIMLRFKAKGGKQVQKEFRAPRLGVAIEALRKLSGRRLFQYRAQNGDVRRVTAHDVNEFLREIAGAHISLKDFRTLLASVQVLEALAREQPAASKRGRRRQVLEAIRAAAEDLANTPTICAKSYVHESVVTAFEDGALEQFAETLKSCRSGARREKVLAQVIEAAA
jgi:DNA topoisomerase-1